MVDKNALAEALGEHSFEYRLCYLLLFFAATDGELSDDEIVGTAAFLDGVLESLDQEADSKALVLGCLDDLQDPDTDLVKETIDIFGEHFPKATLKKMASGIKKVIGVDDLSADEAEMIEYIKSEWGLA